MPDDLPLINKCYMHLDSELAIVNQLPRKFELKLNEADDETFIAIEKVEIFIKTHCTEEEEIPIYIINSNHITTWPTEGTTTAENCYLENAG